jgi:hypothetical protein
MKLENDLTFSLADYVELDGDSASPASIVDRVLQRLRAAYPRALSRADLAADALCGGSVAAIGKALQRLASRGLVEVVGQTSTGARPSNLYQAVLSRDMCVKECPKLEKPSQGLGSKKGQALSVSSFDGAAGAKEDTPTACPDLLSSDTKGSGITGQVFEHSPREERTAEELEQLMQEAARMWE